ncbi:acid phosphatase [Sphingomonas crusticola]|uniref:acid phosphatase n=1 Tax=Sphingomonas crusticola TaxID=1697973 RepID=UPI0019684F66|nr:phosphatase PAP2 family protein [Sphingomonas crusticola]
MKQFTVPALAAFAGLAIAATPVPGYLDQVFDLTTIVPPAPVKGDIRYAADRRVFKATRAMLDTPRGRLATDDVPSSVIEVEKDFSCAAGTTLSPEATPATHRLLVAANADTARANNAAKDHWKRLRPFLIDKGPTCESKEDLAKSYDYPSGHTTRGWTFGLILSELEPDRATPILIRARAYGESRIVCGAHNMSAVDAGRTGASATMQAIRATAAYQADLVAARRELVAARANPALAPEAGACSTEMALSTPSVLTGLRK